MRKNYSKKPPGSSPPRVTEHRITDDTRVVLVEPPCGSNTAILESRGEVLFIDSGYALYREQAEYNQYAPVLMTSVDTDPERCAAERAAIFQRLGAGAWKLFGSHGAMKEYSLRVE